MKFLLVGAVAAASLMSAAPASAQRIDVGPGGVGVDMRTRAERQRDYAREEYRRDREDDRELYRRQRFEDGRRGDRRGYDY